MSEHLRAFVVITFLMAVAYVISKRLFAHALEPKFIERLYRTGYAATALMFLSYNVWVLLAGLSVLSFLVSRRQGHPLALFVFLLLLVPYFPAQIPGFGFVNYLITLYPVRVLSLSLLLPTALHLANSPNLPKPGKLFADKLVVAYALYTSFMTYLHNENFTVGLRHLAEITLDFVLLYYVASRALTTRGTVRHVIVAVVVAAIYLALVGAFEFGKHWLLYQGVSDALGAHGGGGYLMRNEMLRGLATSGQPIVLGFVMMLATLLTVYAQRLLPSNAARVLLWFVIILGSVAALSRGPWVGTFVGICVIAIVSVNPVSNFFKLSITSIGAGLMLLMLPGGEKIIKYLPWVGAVDEINIAFREILWQQAWLVIHENLWLGSAGYRESPLFDVIRQSNGVVDVVNSYLGVILSYGLIGFGFYALLFLLVLYQNINHIRVTKVHDMEYFSRRSVWLGAIVASLITMGTVSSIYHITPLLTLLAGFGVSNVIVANKCKSSEIGKCHQILT